MSRRRPNLHLSLDSPADGDDGQYMTDYLPPDSFTADDLVVTAAGVSSTGGAAGGSGGAGHGHVRGMSGGSAGQAAGGTGTAVHSTLTSADQAPAYHQEIDTSQYVAYEDLELLHKLGSGASASVYLARHKHTGQLYAVKQINLFEKGKKDMFVAELQALYNADSDALVSFYGASYREGQVNVILEYADLGSLDRVLARAPGGVIPEWALANMFYQAAWGLAYLQVEKRVHRDLKPQNILVLSSGAVKLTDFGISRTLATAMMARTFVGSFKYMSPERIIHAPYSYESDVWSLGICLYECGTGTYPYPEQSSQIAIIMSLTEGDPPELPYDAGFTPEFRDVLHQCLQKEPSARTCAADLLQAPWFELHGAYSLEDAVANTRAWLEEAGFVQPTLAPADGDSAAAMAPPPADAPPLPTPMDAAAESDSSDAAMG